MQMARRTEFVSFILFQRLYNQPVTCTLLAVLSFLPIFLLSLMLPTGITPGSPQS